MSSRPIKRGVQQPQILVAPAGVVRLDAAEEAIELADHYGMRLDLSQKVTLRNSMGTDEVGKWAAPTACDAESRQNGKGESIQAREGWGAMCAGERIMHTAHEMPTVNQAFLRMVGWLNGNRDLKQKIRKVWYGNGTQAIEFRNDAQIFYRTRTGAGGLGFDDIDLLIYDEAQHLMPEHLAATGPTMAVAPNPQLWAAGSAGRAFSAVWWSWRLQALRGDNNRFAYAEHTAEKISFDDEGKLVSVAPDPQNERARATANPAYGTRIGKDYLDDQLRRMGAALFLREHMGVWDPLPEDLLRQPAAIPAEAWSSTLDAEPFDPSRLVAAFDVDPGGESATIAVATGHPTGGVLVELRNHASGSLWLPDRLADLVEARHPVKIGFAPGPAGDLLPDIANVFRSRSLDLALIEPLVGRSYHQAVGAFIAGVKEPGKVHRAIDQEALNLAVEAGITRSLGDGAVVWERRDATVAGSPLVATTVAHALWLTLPDEKPPKRPGIAGVHDDAGIEEHVAKILAEQQAEFDRLTGSVAG